MTPYATVRKSDAIINALLTFSAPERLAWEQLAHNDKNVLLRQAMQRIESLKYAGRTAENYQERAFPREGQKDIPRVVCAALALDAAHLAWLATDKEAAQRKQLQAQGVKSFSIGKLSESYADTKKVDVVCKEAMQLLQPYLLGGARFA